MVQTRDRYWDLETCSWVEHVAIEVPEQVSPAEPVPTPVSVAEDGDVRSE